MTLPTAFGVATHVTGCPSKNSPDERDIFGAHANFNRERQASRVCTYSEWHCKPQYIWDIKGKIGICGLGLVLQGIVL